MNVSSASLAQSSSASAGIGANLDLRG